LEADGGGTEEEVHNARVPEIAQVLLDQKLAQEAPLRVKRIAQKARRETRNAIAADR
jgi:hypothetical protein